MDQPQPQPKPERKQITRFIGYWAVLSNVHACDVEGVNGWRFQTLEHAYQAAKVDPAAPNAQNWYQRIYKAATPAEAKRLGRLCPLRSDWEQSKIEEMRCLLARKFSHPTLRKMLLETGDAELIENNTWGDTFWGVYIGTGENWLGKLLMELREGIRAQGLG